MQTVEPETRGAAARWEWFRTGLVKYLVMKRPWAPPIRVEHDVPDPDDEDLPDSFRVAVELNGVAVAERFTYPRVCGRLSDFDLHDKRRLVTDHEAVLWADGVLAAVWAYREAAKKDLQSFLDGRHDTSPAYSAFCKAVAEGVHERLGLGDQHEVTVKVVSPDGNVLVVSVDLEFLPVEPYHLQVTVDDMAVNADTVASATVEAAAHHFEKQEEDVYGDC